MNASVYNAPVGSILIAARYDNSTGAMLDVRAIPVTVNFDASEPDDSWFGVPNVWTYPMDPKESFGNQARELVRKYTHKFMLVDGTTYAPLCDWKFADFT
ncbi:MAG: hypothetical protein E7425_14385 [Ruminococcaceae bacterium]|nr:hypothetical protein [Oscillospiraceae bacterium]